MSNKLALVTGADKQKAKNGAELEKPLYYQKEVSACGIHYYNCYVRRYISIDNLITL